MNEKWDVLSGLNLASSCIPSYCISYEVHIPYLQMELGRCKEDLDKGSLQEGTTYYIVLSHICRPGTSTGVP